jgi:2,3-dihydroxybenzoate decarboxylase
MRKIDLEEHFMTDEMEPYFEDTFVNITKDLATRGLESLKDFGAARLDAMDAAGVDKAVLSLSGPGVQIERDAAKAVSLARQCNDVLAEQVLRRQDRYAGFAHLALQDPAGASEELRRCVTELGFVGALVNGQSNGVYLDDPRYEEFWAAVAELKAPIYLHPANPETEPVVFEGRDVLCGPMWSWTMETSAHALRLVVAGVFERHPGAQLILGHMGECLPFHLWRFDSRYQVSHHEAYTLPQPPSFYIRRNVAITTAGVCDDAALLCSLAALGEDRVMFSVDYPFEHSAEAGRWLDAAQVDDAIRAKVAYGNAERLLRI